MRVKRYKKIRKYLHFYNLTFGFRPPYKIVYGEFIHSALQGKLFLKEQFPKLFQGATTPYITLCILKELEANPKRSGAVHIAKTLSFLKCLHPKGYISSTSCINFLIDKGNPDYLCVAAQDLELRNKLREIPGIPLLYIHGNVPVMDPPSKVCVNHTIQKSLDSAKPLKKEVASLKELKQNSTTQTPQINRKRKAKGPNPLSVKKPTKKPKLSTSPYKNDMTKHPKQASQAKLSNQSSKSIQHQSINKNNDNTTPEPSKRRKRKKTKPSTNTT